MIKPDNLSSSPRTYTVEKENSRKLSSDSGHTLCTPPPVSLSHTRMYIHVQAHRKKDAVSKHRGHRPEKAGVREALVHTLPGNLLPSGTGHSAPVVLGTKGSGTRGPETEARRPVRSSACRSGQTDRHAVRPTFCLLPRIHVPSHPTQGPGDGPGSMVSLLVLGPPNWLIYQLGALIT